MHPFLGLDKFGFYEYFRELLFIVIPDAMNQITYMLRSYRCCLLQLQQAEVFDRLLLLP